MKPRHVYILALALALGVFATPQAFAQSDESFMREEVDRLWGNLASRSQNWGNNYRGRPVAATYELEVQMDHIDKVMEQDDVGRLNAIRAEQARRGRAQSEARRQAEAARREAESQAIAAKNKAYIDSQYQWLAEQKAKLDQQRRESDARSRAVAEQRQARMQQQVEDFYNRARSNTGKPWYVPAQLPTTSEPLFPVPQSNPKTGYFSDWPE